MKKKLVLKIIISILVIVALVYIFNVTSQKELLENSNETINENEVPLGLDIEVTEEMKEQLKEQVVNISTPNEVIINNKNIEEDIIDAMIVDIDYDELDNEIIKIMLVNGESYEAVLIKDATIYNDSLNIADEIKFNGEVKDGKIYISKIIEIKSMMEGLDV